MRTIRIATALLLTLLAVATFVSSALSAAHRQRMQLASVEEHIAPPNDAPVIAGSEPAPVDIPGSAAELIRELLGMTEIFTKPIRGAREIIQRSPRADEAEAKARSSEDEEPAEEPAEEFGDDEGGLPDEPAGSNPADGSNGGEEPPPVIDEGGPPPTGGVAAPGAGRPDDGGGSPAGSLDIVGMPSPPEADEPAPALP
jgi:hypothetical protein